MNIPIRLYYHCAMLNHWRDIVREQLTVIKESGLYEQCEHISVGCLGDNADFLDLQRIFIELGIGKATFYPNPDIKRYEFHTLKVLKGDCNSLPLFYGMYVMNKATSYPPEHEAFLGGQFWRHHMNHWIIKRWEENYRILNLKFMSYDLIGVKVIPARVSPSRRTHISGNFFWFNSEYIRSLPPIESLNQADRFEAENYACGAQPIIYTPCQLFVDYYSRHPDYDLFIKNYPQFKDHCM